MRARVHLRPEWRACESVHRLCWRAQYAPDCGQRRAGVEAVREAQKPGKACPRVVEMSIRELLASPLDEVRKELNIAAGDIREVHSVWKSEGIDPYDLLDSREESRLNLVIPAQAEIAIR